MTATVGKLMSAQRTQAESGGETPDPGNPSDSPGQLLAEYWASRIMWSLVTMISLWDIAVTFGRQSILTARLF
jgi:hypothetical protein